MGPPPKLKRLFLRAGLQNENEKLIRKYEELQNAFKEKNRALLQAQELYDKLKKRAMLGQMELAATDAVDSTLNSISTSDTQRFYQDVSRGHREPQFSNTEQTGQPQQDFYASQRPRHVGNQDWGRPPPRPPARR